MITCNAFYETLTKNGISFFTGVPDSLLKDFSAYLTDQSPADRHIIAANEGNAVGLAMGSYLATGQPALVYMQNSGQGNAANPLISLADPKVYGIPMLLLVGWRGKPGIHDEPQHRMQGEITLDFFETLQIPTNVLSTDPAQAFSQVEALLKQAKEESRPVALVVEKGTFEKYTLQNATKNSFSLHRETAIEHIVEALPTKAVVVATTGKIARELNEIRQRRNENGSTDFLVVGGMGHALQIAAGIAQEKPDHLVCCLDGDGAALMHLGGLGVVASMKQQNLRHIILNNGAHDSVGGQPTIGFKVQFNTIAIACGYASAKKVVDAQELKKELSSFMDQSGPSLLEICVALGSREDLGRPKNTPQENKKILMEALSNE